MDNLLNKTAFNNKRQLIQANGEVHQEAYVTFEELFSNLFAKMTHMHQIKRSSAPLSSSNPINIVQTQIRKGKFQPIEFKLESRGGNKKMTAVSRLAPFLIDMDELKTKIRKLIGCSVTVNELESSSVTICTTTTTATAATGAGAAANNDEKPLINSSTSTVTELNFILYVQGNQIYQVSEILKSKP